MGGLGLDPPAIATILASMEVLGGILQLLFFAPLHNRLGGKALSVYDLAFYPHCCSFPYHESRQPRVWNDPLCMVPCRSSDIFVRLRKPRNQ